jgi:hypothetical protein
MVLIHYHEMNTIVPQYGFKLIEITDDSMTVSQLISHMYEVLQVDNIPMIVYNVINDRFLKYRWSYNRYIPHVDSKSKLELDDLITKYNKILIHYDHSQHNEDHVIKNVFNIIGTKNKYCIEIGAGDGKFTSNTILLRNQGWNGILIDNKEEPNHELVNAKYIKKFISKGNVQNIFGMNNVPTNFDFLSIDIDSHDYHIWKAIEDYRPRLVCIEVDADYRYEEYVRDYTDSSRTKQSSASIISMNKLAEEKMYTLIYNNGGNAFYVPNEEFNKFIPFTKSSQLNKLNTIYNNMTSEKSQTYSVRNNIEMDNYMNIIKSYITKEGTSCNDLFVETTNFL